MGDLFKITWDKLPSPPESRVRLNGHCWPPPSPLALSHRYGGDAKVVHFLGKMKPWNYSYDAKSRTVKGDLQDQSTLHPSYLLQWWDIYSSVVLPLMKEHYGNQPFYSGIDEPEEIHHGVSHIHVSMPPQHPSISSEERKQKWEQGQADYMGMDSFDNIQRKLDSFLN
ncbi:hypothetical protein JZ751_013796 [Albula glossodonta]|uniref:Glycogenin n=1 Tax=Albula glossodonta TaxID=121402 RepID=A0A8T2NVT4_9TELE|nr:hypothetical protein JZ751_013796 [Albula glossodonta]